MAVHPDGATVLVSMRIDYRQAYFGCLGCPDNHHVFEEPEFWPNSLNKFVELKTELQALLKRCTDHYKKYQWPACTLCLFSLCTCGSSVCYQCVVLEKCHHLEKNLEKQIGRFNDNVARPRGLELRYNEGQKAMDAFLEKTPMDELPPTYVWNDRFNPGLDLVKLPQQTELEKNDANDKLTTNEVETVVACQPQLPGEVDLRKAVFDVLFE